MRLDELAYLADLRDRLLAGVEISDTQLLELANERATAIKTALPLHAASDDADTIGLQLESPPVDSSIHHSQPTLLLDR
ncbi:MAG: hypothetical protein ACI9HY_002392 [Planctomycetaceae bacterium]